MEEALPQVRASQILETLLEKCFLIAHSEIFKSPYTRTPMNNGLDVYVGEETFRFRLRNSVLVGHSFSFAQNIHLEKE
jgi:hypothetical protein